MANLNSFVAVALLFIVQAACTLGSEVCRLIAVQPLSPGSLRIGRLAVWECSVGGAISQ